MVTKSNQIINTEIRKEIIIIIKFLIDINNSTSVRLGEHQVSTEIDCRTIKGKRTCAPRVEDIEVEDYFIHEQFARRYNDIALVKLARDVEFQRECLLKISSKIY